MAYLRNSTECGRVRTFFNNLHGPTESTGFFFLLRKAVELIEVCVRTKTVNGICYLYYLTVKVFSILVQITEQ